MAQIINSLIKWGIFFGILYLIFTNFGTFLIILFTIIAIGYYALYQFKKKFQQNASGFRFTFNGQDFNTNQTGGFHHRNFDFNQFQEQFRQGNFNAPPQFNEVQKAKDFFGFTDTPSKEDIKRKYKELAKKYHPDINNHGDELMQQLNHYKDVLMKAYAS